jgi:DNA-binding LacI/PurR family transcriptional regulator
MIRREARTDSNPRVTIRDVARHAKVAPSTVSAVMNDSAHTSPETRLRVLQAMRELAYEPDANARNLKRRRAESIGLVVPEFVNPFFAVVAEAVEQTAREEDLTVVLCSTRFEQPRELDYMRLLRTSRLDGVILNSGLGRALVPHLALAQEQPIVVVDERVPGLEAPFVGADNRSGARAAARHVIEHGHERIGIVTGPVGLWTADQRHAGYREELVAAGLDPDGAPVANGDFRVDGGMRAAAALLSAEPGRRPTALLVANDLMAIGCLKYCANAGISVPGEVSIVGFDDIAIAELWEPGLTTVTQQAWEMGAAAARLLIAAIDAKGSGTRVAPTEQLFPTSLAVRGTVGRPPGAAPRRLNSSAKDRRDR